MTRGCVIKQIADVGNWGSVLLRKSGRQGRPCLSVIPTKEEGSWGIYHRLLSDLFGSGSQQDYLPDNLACPTLECSGLWQPEQTLGQSQVLDLGSCKVLFRE